jgi:CDP-paratose 2-epimerase
MQEGIALCEEITGNKMSYSYDEGNRSGDHIWYISDLRKFKEHYPSWNWKYDLKTTLAQMHDNISKRV